VRRHAANDGRRRLHCRLSINGGTLFVADDFPEYTRRMLVLPAALFAITAAKGMGTQRRK
jgi:hypothetical protein